MTYPRSQSWPWGQDGLLALWCKDSWAQERKPPALVPVRGVSKLSHTCL